MMQWKQCVLFAAAALAMPKLLHAVTTMERQFKVVNESGERVSVEWVDPNDGHRIPLGAPTSGESVNINSFVNHTFVIRSEEASLGDENCTEEYYQVTDDEIQILIVKDGLVVEQSMIHDLKPSSGKAAKESEQVDFTSDCRKQAERALKKKNLPQSVIFERLTECLTQNAAELIVEKSDELVLEANLRVEMSRLAENYTCADPTKEVSTPIAIKTWNHKGVDREVHILHERPGSQIHMLKDFISAEECQAIQDLAEPLLHRGTVADGKGGSKMSENRKAWQAGLKVDWSKEAEGDPLANVKRRLFDYANQAAGYSMQVEGQEDVMSIQYFGNGLDDPTPDRYMPHCDGQCDGLPFKTGGRVATMVMYCDVPEVGGATNFQNAGVFVKPVKGAAAFFSYLNPETMVTESGFTTHSGCPVLQGTKRIAVQWMRIGVDENNPWDSFDTNTVQYKEYQ
uniref:Fe2OG dioxygenase domain-containing protein n=1 Tax=Amphora coffeiformis TaxID=265554 RepID=A0A7S3LDH7_9STRA|mmetsp:Transcript_17711/g.35606  ORF Transcript_17711/g.35606 Transcript_17711/m.35606 type:complete len:455 (+) Transcript_17711:239-1603(+)|eukprot:scaffold2657_cov89-Amphora_coffeaeformis.AAC.11